MADYDGKFRSNYFKVKDKEKFLEWCLGLDVDTWEHDGHPGEVAFGNYESIPWCRYEEDGESKEIDFNLELSSHLVDGEVAVYQEVGNEKLRYVSGFAVAVRSDGRTLTVGLNDVFKKVERYWKKGMDEITDCAY